MKNLALDYLDNDWTDLSDSSFKRARKSLDIPSFYGETDDDLNNTDDRLGLSSVIGKRVLHSKPETPEIVPLKTPESLNKNPQRLKKIKFSRVIQTQQDFLLYQALPPVLLILGLLLVVISIINLSNAKYGQFFPFIVSGGILITVATTTIQIYNEKKKQLNRKTKK